MVTNPEEFDIGSVRGGVGILTMTMLAILCLVAGTLIGGYMEHKRSAESLEACHYEKATAQYDLGYAAGKGSCNGWRVTYDDDASAT